MEKQTTARSKFVDGLTEFSYEKYQSIDLTGLAAYTIQLLQENYVPTTNENIAVALFKQFPKRFCLEAYEEYLDAARVGRTLMQLGPKYRNWATGKVKTGFVLTDSGIRKVDEVRRILKTAGSPVNIQTQRKSSPRTMDRSPQLDALESSMPFQFWTNGELEEVRPLDIVSMLGAVAYTPPKAMRDRVKTLSGEATDFDRPELVAFLTAVKQTFPQIFKDK